MKYFLIIFIFLSKTSHSFAQDSIKGLWYSSDSTRVYKIYDNEKGLQAILVSSKRKNDKMGALVLDELQYNCKKRKFFGFIYGINDNDYRPQFAKLKLSNNGNVLKLKLPRMFLFPVNLYWIKCT